MQIRTIFLVTRHEDDIELNAAVVPGVKTFFFCLPHSRRHISEDITVKAPNLATLKVLIP